MNLSKFLNQHVDITLRNGCTMTDVLVAPNPYSYKSGFIYPFLIVQEGISINVYTREGMLWIFSEDPRDIVKIIQSQSHSDSDSESLKPPQTVDDLIKLLQGVKATYGGKIEIKWVTSSEDPNDFRSHMGFLDAHVVMSPKSLVQERKSEVRLVFEV